MKTIYEIDKIKAVILYILQKSGGTLDYITLFKKMYFAQQSYLVRYGHPIFNDSFKAHKRGPVPSFTYRAFSSAALGYVGNESPEIKDFDSSFIVKEISGVKYVSANARPDMDEIAQAEIDVLNEVIKKTEGMSADELSEMSHDKAWEIAIKRALDDPTDNYIPLVSIARAGGANKEMLNYIRQNQFVDEFCKG